MADALGEEFRLHLLLARFAYDVLGIHTGQELTCLVRAPLPKRLRETLGLCGSLAIELHRRFRQIRRWIAWGSSSDLENSVVSAH